MSVADKIRARKSVKATVALLIVIPIVLIAMEWLTSWNVYPDPGTGAAARYYVLTPEGYRFYDAPGEDPTYGVPLKPVTEEVITAVRARQEAQLHEYESLDEAPYLFHPTTGKPGVWYSADPKGKLRFFSRPGHNPRTGWPLEPITTSVVELYQEQKRVAEERVALERAERAEHKAYKAEADLWAAEVALRNGQRKLRSAGRAGRARGRSATRYSQSRIATNTTAILSVHSSDGERIVIGGRLEDGARFYADRSYTIAGLPSDYIGLPYIRLAYKSKRSPIGTTITVLVDRATWVYIAWDQRVPASPWLVREYEDTGRRLYLAERNWAYRIYKSMQPITSGQITTRGQTPSDNSFYLIFLRSQ